MAENRGKQFEGVIRESFEKVYDCSVDRLHDQTNGFKGSTNICDFIVYKFPHLLYLECKSCHGNTWPLANLTKNQRQGLLSKSRYKGINCGVIIWWIDKDVTMYFPILYIQKLYEGGYKSIKFTDTNGIVVHGKKKRVFFDYDMTTLLKEMNSWEN